MEKKFNLHRDEIPEVFHDPYIKTGYRHPNLSIYESVKSAFHLKCNESFNILSHLIATIWFIHVFISSPLNIADTYTWPLACHALGNIAFTSMSTLAHTFNSMSHSARHRCFYFDYAAISTYTVGACQAFIFYVQPHHSNFYIFNSPWTFNVIGFLISIGSTYLNCLTRTRFTSYKYLVRTSAYIISSIWSTTPYFCRLYMCNSEIDCDKTGYSLFKYHVIFFGLTAFANVSKLPEKIIESKFDHFGQSHHLMHVFITIGCYFQFEFTKHEMKRGRSDATPYSISLIFLISAFAINICIASITSTEEPFTKKKKMPNSTK